MSTKNEIKKFGPMFIFLTMLMLGGLEAMEILNLAQLDKVAKRTHHHFVELRRHNDARAFGIIRNCYFFDSKTKNV